MSIDRWLAVLLVAVAGLSLTNCSVESAERVAKAMAGWVKYDVHRSNCRDLPWHRTTDSGSVTTQAHGPTIWIVFHADDGEPEVLARFEYMMDIDFITPPSKLPPRKNRVGDWELWTDGGAVTPVVRIWDGIVDLHSASEIGPEVFASASVSGWDGVPHPIAAEFVWVVPGSRAIACSADLFPLYVQGIPEIELGYGAVVAVLNNDQPTYEDGSVEAQLGVCHYREDGQSPCGFSNGLLFSRDVRETCDLGPVTQLKLSCSSFSL